MTKSEEESMTEQEKTIATVKRMVDKLKATPWWRPFLRMERQEKLNAYVHHLLLTRIPAEVLDRRGLDE